MTTSSTPTVTRDADLLRALAERIDPTDPGAFNNLGVLYHSKGMYAEAVDALLRAVTLDPRMQTAMRNLEFAAQREGACDARLAALAARVEANADDRDAAREESRLLRLIGRHADAARKLDALIAEDPDDGAALLERGLLEQRVGDLRRAQRWFERAVNADAQNPIARLQLAEVMYQRGLNEQALVTLDALLAAEPNLSDAHLLRGFVLGDLGQSEAGLEATRRATLLNPTLARVQPNLTLEQPLASTAASDGAARNSGVFRVVATGELPRYGLGLAFRQRGYFAEARQELARALAHGEDERLVRHAMAELDLVAGQYDAAQVAYTELLAKYGEHARWRNELGVALHQRGDLGEAAENYRSALRNDPRYALAYNNLGVALSDLGHPRAAREALERASAIDSSLVRAKLNLARWYVDNGELDTALAQLTELSAYHAANADVWHDMAVVFVALRRPDDAHRALSRAIDCDASHAGARYTLAALLHARGDDDGALRETEQALVRAPVRGNNRLHVGIELQAECPEAAGSLDLLAVRATTPLAGASLSSTALESLLPERAVADRALTDDAVPEPPLPDMYGGVVAHAALAPKRSTPANGAIAPPDADAFAARGLHGEALERYEQTCAETEWAGPHDAWRAAAIGVARSKCLLGRGAEARELLDRLLDESNDRGEETAEVLALLSAAHAAAWEAPDEPRLARAAIAAFLRTESRSAALLHFVGDVAISIREDALAIVLFRRALAVDPSRPTPRVAIARLLRRRDDMLAARLELAAALAVAPALRDAVLELARLHCDTGNPAAALPMLVSHLHRNPTDTDAMALLAHTLVLAGRTDDARHALVRARRHDPSHPMALWLEGKLLADQQRVREARERWSLLLATAPNSEEATWARAALDGAARKASGTYRSVTKSVEVTP